MRVGICGGTFDPFHRGHLDPILAVREAMQWDRILYIPAFIQPFKQDRETTSGHHRFAMAVLATEAHDDVFVDARELERGAISYTVDTLRELRRDSPGDTFDWIIGDDHLEKLHEWKSIETILELANFVVLTRTPHPDPLPASGERGLKPECCSVPSPRVRGEGQGEGRPNGAILYAENPTVPISSTEIRRRVRAGESIDELVDPRVSRYIQHYGLYGKGQT